MNPSLSGAQTLPDNDGQDISALLLSNRTKAARQEREVFLAPLCASPMQQRIGLCPWRGARLWLP